MRPNERRQHILELLRQRERISVDELARTLHTSQETIRRDLTELAENGQVTKFHGGASLPPSGEHENAFQTRMNEFSQEKRAVARYAAGLYAPGDSILIDTGTTTLFFARELARLNRITVITNSLLIAEAMGVSGNRVFMIGGEFRPESNQNSGSLALEQIARFNAEHAVVTIGALSADGAFDFSIEEAEIARAMIARARYLTVIADSSKLGRRALFQVFPLERIDRLIIDRKPIGELAEALARAQVEVHEAPLLQRTEWI
ncbi:DeoR/GlpR family DNA-binding transcription regulator [Pseudomonas gingeri]|uniref:DeoR/GlpR transcriptional regulator n=1 Tax=Pseudomonas gingeri TaxID=117681 RepID=A0A7Y8CIZ6_9PSED|nr:DeoR/GlpR family DNA-binding transcription regulator [Pseudomonas gingeri]NWA01697.1 DeoR/GlpR transcriptional regulator [Pseudomonas gingeri]NWA12796.1 DeoR/GlpR transcriptional regulator [Pseudomonas gingeri]NWA57538.1 DeoR/GlpR transcriptional regulator [Pseudomonas gingeri]NWA93167.1 DeoR/GlpR transcriptional regulator [Pseudomonas gingeri]NWB03473.1 DeoR/GlpR transcriptional regulator [Pseudomonas gingeri]